MKNIEKIKNFNVQFTAPPSKAHTLRALAIAALADGQSTIRRPLLADDQHNMIACLKQLGINIQFTGDTIIVTGNAGKFSPAGTELNVGESGVTMNFLTAAACTADKPVILTGSSRIQERPVDQIVDGMRQLGCKIDYLKNQGCVPLKIHAGGIKGGRAKMFGQRSSQYFSAIAISAPLAQNDCIVECVDDMTERPYFDISLDMMAKFGVKAENKSYKTITIPGRQKYWARDITIEGDYSSASFFFLAAAICEAKINITGLTGDSKQGDKKFVDLLARMGCRIEHSANSIALAGGKLNPIIHDMSNVPDLVPPLAVAAAFANGKSVFTNIGHLRHKESDRLAVVAEELKKMGITAYYDDDSLTVEGNPAGAKGTTIDPHNDHRIAMSFAAAGLVTGNQQIDNEKCVTKSFPDFWEKFEIFR